MCIRDSLKQFDIKERVIDDDNYKEVFEKIDTSDVDYEIVYKNIEKYKKESLNYLKENIGG